MGQVSLESGVLEFLESLVGLQKPLVKHRMKHPQQQLYVYDY